MIYSCIYLICYDIWYYFIHYLLHTRHFYFIHKIHHKNVYPKFNDYYLIHILEIPIQSIGLLVPIYFYKLHILQLFYALLFINIRGLLEHDERMIFLVGNHHLIHHKIPKYNFGAYWLDYIFGTLYENRLIN
jgi:sterol desaturase/sphingolipid hydroxylase (fatty acid hydroxylase superfamily)